MEECSELKLLLKDKDSNMNDLHKWIKSKCNCEICENYNYIIKFIGEDYFKQNKFEFIKNENFKKINLTDTMKEVINYEIYNKILFSKLFKISK